MVQEDLGRTQLNMGRDRRSMDETHEHNVLEASAQRISSINVPIPKTLTPFRFPTLIGANFPIVQTSKKT